MSLATLSESPTHPNHETIESAGTLRVLHVINGEHYSGAERVQDLLAARLPDHGCEVGFACVKPGRFAAMRTATEASLHEIPMRGRFDLTPVRSLVAIVRQQGYHLLHAHTPRTVLLAGIVSLITGTPLIYHVHSPTSRDSTRKWTNRVNAWIERVTLMWASAVIVVSHSLGRHLRDSGVPGEKIHVVANGVPCSEEALNPSDADQQSCSRSWTLGTVALFRPRKGVEVLLEAVARLRAAGLPIRLHAVGGFETPEYERTMLEKTCRLGLEKAVTWTGFTRDVNRELARMDLFVLPSLFGEGLPMVVLEAMAAGVPVVATRVEGTPEAVRDGLDGVIVAPNDPEDLARGIRRVVEGEMDWTALRRSAIERQAECFSDRSMAAGVAEVYRQVAASKR